MRGITFEPVNGLNSPTFGVKETVNSPIESPFNGSMVEVDGLL